MSIPSFIYPRTISVRRPKTVNPATSVGDRGYSAQRGPVDEDVIIAGPVAASVQLSSGGKGKAGVPSDPGVASASIFIPATAGIALGAIKEADVVTDDMGRRFLLSNAYWTSLGWKLTGSEMTV